MNNKINKAGFISGFVAFNAAAAYVIVQGLQLGGVFSSRGMKH